MSNWQMAKKTGLIILQDGTRLSGVGIGALGYQSGEICFNTAMSGYQEILTDPSYAEQIICFTFPHIGNVGTNDEDDETSNMGAQAKVRGCIIKANISSPANYRSTKSLDKWLKERNIIGICGVDTRALTSLIREKGMPNAVIAHSQDGQFDEELLKKELKSFPGLVGLDLTKQVTTNESYIWDETIWQWKKGFGKNEKFDFHIVAIDYGAKKNILRCLATQGAKLTIVPATSSAKQILALKPDGVFLSNGPGDPAATAKYSSKVIKELIDNDIAIFGICLGHQLLGLALGAKTVKMHQGHHGANHPVQDLTTTKVEITSMNHGFAIDAKTLPDNVVETHKSLFDGSNCGIALKDKPVFSVQYHPEASPGPHDSHYLFIRFANYLRQRKGLAIKSETEIITNKIVDNIYD